jgi:hypothetical protein
LNRPVCFFSGFYAPVKAHYVEKAIKKDASYWQLYKDPDLADLRTFPAWSALMQKYFPEQVKK